MYVNLMCVRLVCACACHSLVTSVNVATAVRAAGRGPVPLPHSPKPNVFYKHPLTPSQNSPSRPSPIIMNSPSLSQTSPSSPSYSLTAPSPPHKLAPPFRSLLISSPNTPKAPLARPPLKVSPSTTTPHKTAHQHPLKSIFYTPSLLKIATQPPSHEASPLSLSM